MINALDLSYPEEEFAALSGKLKPRLNQAGWLTSHFPQPRRGWLLTPFEPIPVMLFEPDVRARLTPVFCVCPAEWTPEANQLYARYLDLPYLIRALQTLYPAAGGRLRVYLYSSRGGWFYSANRDQAIPIPHEGRWVGPEDMEDARIWESSTPQVSMQHSEPDENALAQDLAGWLRKWEVELGSNTAQLFDAAGGAAAFHARNLIYTLILLRMHRTLGRAPGFPEVYPPAPFVALADAPGGGGACAAWDDPAQYLFESFGQLPAAYHPDAAAARAWIQRVAAARNEALIVLLRRLLGELSLLCNAKFDGQVFTLALCSADEARRAWQLSITHPIQISAALGSEEGLARSRILFDPHTDSPGRLAGWIDALARFWANQIQKQLIAASDRDSISVQTDWIYPLPEQLDQKQLLAYFLHKGLATSFSVASRGKDEHYRLRVMLSALSLRLVREYRSLGALHDNFADDWLGERDA